ncbi:MAG TPA: PQQ-binding-like beta-propeller repeat protein [Bryobacteraceae bacterium]|nr:PQQ-binding-like beta-propeller repeat protein [Bryobacteraceae bacterium]
MRVLTFFLAICSIACADDWPQFRGNPSLTGIATSPVPKTLKLLWTFEAGDSIESSAAIVDGVVYVGSQSADLIAVNLADGKLLWKYKVKDGIGESSPAVHAGIAVIGDLSGTVHAVNAKDGKGLWTFPASGEIKASPVIVDDKVILGSYDGNLYCLSLKDGKLVWAFKTNGPVHATASVAAGLAYISGCDGVLRGIRIADGKEMVSITTGAYTGASPVFSPTQNVYFGTFNNDVLAFNVKTKKPLWRYENPQRQFPFYSSAALDGAKVILGGRDKVVHCLNAQTGKQLWEFATRSRVESSPAVIDGRVYVGSNDGRFYVLDEATGAKLWDFEAGAPLSASPAVAQGRIVIGSQDGKLYCFGG